MNQNRVIVAVPLGSSEVAGVFENKDAYEEWLNRTDWNDDQLNVRDCRVKRMNS